MTGAGSLSSHLATSCALWTNQVISNIREDQKLCRDVNKVTYCLIYFELNQIKEFIRKILLSIREAFQTEKRGNFGPGPDREGGSVGKSSKLG